MDSLDTIPKCQYSHLSRYSQANNCLINYDHCDIIALYNMKIRGLLNFYTFAGNRSRLLTVIWVLQQKLRSYPSQKANTKIRSMHTMFKRYGRILKCTKTDVELLLPHTLKASHDYKVNRNAPINLYFLYISWSKKLTESNINKACAICGTSSDIQMHHLRYVKDVRQKIRTGNATFGVWTGAFKRKQIPLCKYPSIIRGIGI